ncbi:Activator of Hsp90 ATPase homolog 1-like protein [Cohaesibacter sp. ES.047]|uniref:SRPBCC domain-containing protein n=1 Tax=Cohaesibacter sp. ES.047 TaxID=1798205 RepID=UPI000BB75235|nr:SRPBCC domain-containing protein [Cohaesibacter sp. ES.047]SNY92503.1 Activator of Hsp90 ATPase homolog 1-like protein [Cohaesibacter sp. ES.047]
METIQPPSVEAILNGMWPPEAACNESDMMLKPIVKVIEVPVDSATAYQLFTEQMGLWWPLDSRSISFHSEGAPAKALNIDPVAGGAIVEIAASDERHVWGRFVDCDPPHSVAIEFHMGQPEEHATNLLVTFFGTGADETLVKLVHSGWETYGGFADMMREGYDTGWDEIFSGAYAKACKGRRPQPAPVQSQ